MRRQMNGKLMDLLLDEGKRCVEREERKEPGFGTQVRTRGSLLRTLLYSLLSTDLRLLHGMRTEIRFSSRLAILYRHV